VTPRHSTAVTVQPSVEPVTLAELKGQCRVEHDADNALLVEWGKAARSMIEEATGRKLLTQTVRVQLGDFPANGEPIRLPVWPVQSVTSVTYRRASDGAETALTGFQAWLDHDPPLLAPPVADSSWPFVDERHLNAVTITLVAGGTSAASVPSTAKQAILLAVGYWNGFRGDGRDPAEMESIPGEAGLPAGCVRLLDLLTQKRYG
jgi:uncharacterized phiE125 gp8 family phage protein